MTPAVHMISNNMISSLGFTTAEHIESFRLGQTGIIPFQTLNETFHVSPINQALLEQEWDALAVQPNYEKLEKLFILSISKTLENQDIHPRNDDCLIILSSTKGNIDVLKQNHNRNAYLYEMTRNIARHFEAANRPQIISTACISGTLAGIMAYRYIKSGRYKHVVVSGGDLLSDFTLSGFNAFKALGNTDCKPFDKNRDGVSLGEGVGTILFSSESQNSDNVIQITGGASSNDANHISGPSRTGDGLHLAIQGAMKQAGLSQNDIGFLSAHGTATPYNDEMEAKAFHLSGLQDCPINSFKGYFGHTLGAAGLLECIAAIESLRRNEIYPSLGFEEMGVSQPVNIIKEFRKKELHHVLKTASGFGGCNASIIFSKVS